MGHNNWVRCANFDPTSRLVATGSDDKLLKLWDVSSPSPLHTWSDHDDTVHSVAFHTDGTSIASGSADKTIRMFDIRSHLQTRHFGLHTEAITSISIHPSGNPPISHYQPPFPTTLLLFLSLRLSFSSYP